MSSGDWRDWKDRTPHLGPRGRAWAARRIAVVVRKLIADAKGPPLSQDLEESVVAWFVERVTSYVCWVDDKEYCGKRWSCGGWHVVVDHQDLLTALRDLEAAAEGRLRQEEAARYPTLDDWLAALHRGEFPELDHPGQGRERNGYDLLKDDRATLDRFLAQRDRLHRTWPRLCTSCGVEFKPDRRNICRCPKCRRARRGRSHA